MTAAILAVLIERADLAIASSGAVLATCVLVTTIELRARRMIIPGETYAIRTAHGSASTESFFTSLHGLRRSWLAALRWGRPWVGLEIRGGGGALGTAIWIPRAERQLVTSLLRAVYPDLELVPSPDAHSGGCVVVGEFALARNKYLPLRMRTNEEPLASVFATLAHVPAELSLQLLARPRSSRWQTGAYGEAQRLREARDGGWWAGSAASPRRASQYERERAGAMESKAASLGFDCVVRAVARAGSEREARAAVRAVAAALLPLGDANTLSLRRVAATRSTGSPERFPSRGASLLVAKELAALWHAPDPEFVAQLLPAVAGAPAGSERGARVIGTSTGGRSVGLSLEDSRLHLHLLGATGTGKTTVLLNLAAQDIASGRGVAVLDPKGDLVAALLERIPAERVDDVVLISPDEGQTCVGINPLELWPGSDRDLVAENALTIFKRIYARYWGPRTDDVLKAALLTLLVRPDATLADVHALLTDRVRRAAFVQMVDDPLGLGAFWQWFDALSEHQRLEATGPVLNKLRDFLVRPRLRRLLCQRRSRVDVRAVVDGGKILLADLAVGRWGESAAALTGSFLVARIWQAVLARSAVPEIERRSFYLYLDEFQHFLGIAGPFTDALAQARGLGLALTIANQHLAQLTPELRDAVAANARSRMVFQCSADDATYLARELAPLAPSQLLALGRFEAAARLAVDGRTSAGFTLQTKVPSPVTGVSAASVRATSARRFGRTIAEVDAELLGVASGEIPLDGVATGPRVPSAESAPGGRRDGVDRPVDWPLIDR